METQNRIGPIVEDYLDRLRNGEKVSARHYAEQYPEMATEILDFLPLIEMLVDINRPLPRN